MNRREDKREPTRWNADELQQQVLQQLGKDHINTDTIRHMVAAGGKQEVLPVLGELAQGAVPGETHYEQANAIYVLGMIKDPAAVHWLEPLLGRASEDLQILAVRALGRIGGDAALAPVRRLYNGREPNGAANGAALELSADSLGEPVPPALALEMRDALNGTKS